MLKQLNLIIDRDKFTTQHNIYDMNNYYEPFSLFIHKICSKTDTDNKKSEIHD
jgi:hypothetical protein